MSDDAVDHMGAHFLQLRSPVDVGLFVEARHEFDHDGDFLAVAGGFEQRLHQLGIGAGAINGLLDGDDVGIDSRLLDETDYRFERLKRMMEQDVAFADGGEDIRRFGKHGRKAGGKGGELEVGAIHPVGYLHQPNQVDRAGHLIEILSAQIELLQQEIRNHRRAQVGDLEPNRVAEMPLRQFALQCQAQILHFFFVHEQVAVAGNAKLIAALHLHSGEQLVDMRMDDR